VRQVALVLLVFAAAGFPESMIHGRTPHVVQIGLMVAVEGPGQAAGLKISSAVERAVREWNAGHRARIPACSVRVIPSELPWGRQMENLAEAISDQNMPVILGAADRRSAHLSGQVAARRKGDLLLLTLSDDRTLTQMGVPWILSGLPRDSGTEDLSRHAYDLTLAVLEAIERSGPTAASIHNYLTSHSFAAPSGRFSFDSRGNRIPGRSQSSATD